MAALRTTALTLLVALSTANSNVRRQVTTSDRDSALFLNRSSYVYHKLFSSIVVGDYLYMDGGEISYMNGSNITAIEAKNTYSIDLSSSWTNQTVSVTQIDKAVRGPSLNGNKLWPGLDNSSFYAYDGVMSWYHTPANPPYNELYKFTSDGSGSGKWIEDTSSYIAGSIFTNLVRVGGAASACGPDTCYAVGGYRNSRTDYDLPDDPPVPAAGMVSHNLTSHFWYNNTLVGTVFKNPWNNGSLFFTNIAGSAGILVAMGGVTTNAAGENPIPMGFDNIYIFDIATDIWYQQNTTGDIPSVPRSLFCTVGVQGDNTVNKTYEIFMYGGETSSGSNLTLDDVWVLSLPSFQWYQAGHTPVRGRSGLSCSIIGRRQMAVIGGVNPDHAVDADIWPLGLGVFDLSDMVFKDHYDAGALPYTSPDVVKRWYAENGNISKNASDDIKRLFEYASTSSTSDSASKGAVVGGIIGALLVVAALAAVVWFYQRHKRNRRQLLRQTCEADGHSRHEADGKKTSMYEADGTQKFRYEADGNLTHEKEALNQQRHELL